MNIFWLLQAITRRVRRGRGLGAEESEFDESLAEMENFLLWVYRFGVVAVRSEREMERAADIWRETLDIVDHAARQVQALAPRHPGTHPSLDRILEIRHAASDMLALYA